MMKGISESQQNQQNQPNGFEILARVFSIGKFSMVNPARRKKQKLHEWIMAAVAAAITL